MSESLDFGSLHGSELQAVLVEKMTQHRVLYAEMLDLIAEMGHTLVADSAGYSSLAAFLAQLLRVTSQKAAKMVAQAEAVEEAVTPVGYVAPPKLPTVRAALHEGLVDGEHIDAIAATINALPDWATLEHRELVETTLGETARVHDPRVVRKHGKILLDRIDQDGTDPHQEDKLAEPGNVFRYCRTRTGGMKFTGHLDHEAAEQLEALLGAYSKPDKDDPRDPHERHGDAMAQVVHAAAGSGDAPAQGGEKPQIIVTLDYNLLLEGLGAATLDDGCALAPSAARRLACDADLIPMVLNGESVPLDVGREHRLVKPKQRKALVARDKDCAFPGCHLPARWADAHHIHHWMDGGATDLENLVLLCRRHHRLVHHSQWSIQMVDGVPWFKPPAWVDPARKLVRNVLRLQPEGLNSGAVEDSGHADDRDTGQ